MLESIKELAQKCSVNHLRIIRVDEGVSEWGALDLTHALPSDGETIDLSLIDYTVTDHTDPFETKYSIEDIDTNAEIMAPSSADDVITFIQNYQPKTTEE